MNDGLTAEEAGRRLAEVGPNELPVPLERPFLLRVARHLTEPITLLLIVVAVLSASVLHEIPEAIAISAIIVLDAIIGLREERRANDALKSLRRMTRQTCLVRRDDIPIDVPVETVVPGDLVLVTAGDRVAADLEIVDANDAEADESILTGESLPVSKVVAARVPGDGIAEQPGLLFSGTLLVRGTVSGVVLATGVDSALGAIAGQLERAEPPTPLQRELTHLSERLGIAAMFIAVGVFILTFFVRGQTLELAFLSAVALAVAAVPQGLPAVVTVGLSLGARRMADEGAVMRRLSAVEALGSTTVILTDKTGTLTEGTLRTVGFVVGGEDVRPLDVLPPHTEEWVEAISILCNDASGAGGDPVDLALLGSMSPVVVQELRASRPRIDALPFSAERARMSVAAGGFGHAADQAVLLVKGSPESVLEICSTSEADGKIHALDEDARVRVLSSASTLASRGMRLLALARRELGPTVGLVRDLSDMADEIERDCVLVSLVAFRDPSRSEAIGAVTEARDAGIRIVMVTGDHPGTAAAIAQEVGLADASSPVRTGPEIRQSGLGDDPSAVAVYARMNPGQKTDLVQRLQEKGETVAVTGDGVNDAPALRHADIGVAMGRAGSDVAREAADMVITDDNLATIVTAIREGRGIYEGIRKVVDYLVAGNLSEITVVLASLLLFPELGVPLLPLQLLWINLVTDGLPALALGADPPVPELMLRPPRPRSARLLSRNRFLMLGGRGLIMGATAVGTLAITRFAWGGSWAEARTVMFTSLITTHVFYAFVVRRPSTGPLTNWRLIAGVGLSILGQVIIVTLPAFHELFNVVSISLRDWLLVAVAAVVALSVIALTQRGGRSGSHWTSFAGRRG